MSTQGLRKKVQTGKEVDEAQDIENTVPLYYDVLQVLDS